MFTPDEAADAIGRAERARQKREDRFLSEDDVAYIAEEVGVSGESARRYLPPRQASGSTTPSARPRIIVTSWFSLFEWCFWAFVLYSMAHLAWHLLTS